MSDQLDQDKRPNNAGGGFSLHARLLFGLIALPSLVGGLTLFAGLYLLDEPLAGPQGSDPLSRQLAWVCGGVIFATMLLICAGAYAMLRRTILGPIHKIGQLVRMSDAHADRLIAPRGAAREFVELTDTLRSAIGGLQQSQEHLAAKNRELERSRQAADAANHAKSQFLASMGHDIRSPMTAIMGYADLLTRQLPKNADVVESVSAIRRNSQQLLGMINDIMDLSKLEIGRAEVDRVLCRPWQIVSEILQEKQPQVRQKKLKLNAICKGQIPQTIRTDQSRFRQMLSNLVDNAIKFTETGQVDVILELDPGSQVHSPRLLVEVADTGIGMTQMQMDRLFQPFALPDAASRRKFGGMGLGLTISRRFARMLGGDLTVRSTHGVGSRFLLTVETGELDGIPLVTEITGDQKPPVLSPVIHENLLHGMRILLAEDGKDNRRLISMHLRNSGAEVLAVEDGREACDAILSGQGGTFELVLMDMEMPLLDGYGATERLRLLGYTGLIVALTANNDPVDRKRCLEIGCNEYISKPVDRQTLVDTVSRLVRAKAGQSTPSQDAA